MVADKVTKMDAKMAIKEHLQRVECAVGTGGCADDNVISRLVGEVVGGCCWDGGGQVGGGGGVGHVRGVGHQGGHQHVQGQRQEVESRVEAVVCDDNIVFGGCQGSDWRFLVGDGHVGEQDEGLGGAQVEGQGQQGGRQDVQGL